MVVGARETFSFSDKKIWFLGNNRGIGFCITWLVLPDYKDY